MPRNGSGVYSKPAGTTAVANTVASSSAYNSLADDLGNEITNSLPRAGTAAPTASLPMGNFRHTGVGDAAATTDYLAAGQAAKGVHDWYGNTSGTNTYTLTATAFVPAALTNGMPVAFRVVNANTGAVTLQVGALAAKSVVRFDNTALASGDWPAGAIVEVRYNSDLDKFVWAGDFGNPAAYAKVGNNLAFTGNNTHAGTETFNGASTFNDQVIEALQTLTDGATINWDMGLQPNAQVTLGGNRTLAAPTNEVAGQRGRLFVIQDGTGSRTLTFNAAYKFPNGVTKRPDPAASSTTCYRYHVRGADDVLIWPVWRSGSSTLGFYKEYDMGTYAIDTVYTQAHGLGRYPDFWFVYLECTSADNGHAVGDRILVGGCASTNGGNVGFSCTANTTNVIAAQSSTRIGNVNPSTTNSAALAASSWKVIFRVYE